MDRWARTILLVGMSAALVPWVAPAGPVWPAVSAQVPTMEPHSERAEINVTVAWSQEVLRVHANASANVTLHITATAFCDEDAAGPARLDAGFRGSFRVKDDGDGQRYLYRFKPASLPTLTWTNNGDGSYGVDLDQRFQVVSDFDDEGSHREPWGTARVEVRDSQASGACTDGGYRVNGASAQLPVGAASDPNTALPYNVGDPPVSGSGLPLDGRSLVALLAFVGTIVFVLGVVAHDRWKRR